MAQGANVNDIDSISEFRVYLIKFIESASAAMSDADSDVDRTLRWLDGDQQAYWQGQIRSRQEALSRAQEALRQKQVFKDSTGRTPSAVEEQKAVAAAQKRVQEATEKLAKVKAWAKRLQKEQVQYKGQVQRFWTALADDLPKAVAHLGALVDRLTQYAALGPAAAGSLLDDNTAGYFGVTPEGSMSRGEGAPKQAESGDVPVADLRARVPPGPARQQAAQVDDAPSQWATSPVGEADLKRLSELAANGAAVPDNERIVIATGASDAQRIFFERSGDSGWYIGAVDAEAASGQNLVSMPVGSLLAARPDLRPLLSLPSGSIVVLRRDGVSAVFNDRNENIWSR